MGQEVLAPPPPEFSVKPPGLRALSANEADQLLTAPQAGGQELPPWGPIHFHPHLLYRLSYGDGIQARPGEQSKTVINEISPGLLLDVGSHWHLDYTPTLRFYSSSRFRDTTDQSVALDGGTAYQDWVFGLSQRYASSSQPLVETGAQTDQVTYSTAINAAYSMSSKISLDLAVSQNFRFVGEKITTQELSDSRTWSATAGLNYQFWPAFSAGLSATFSYDDLSVGSDMTSEQLQGRINWRAGNKLTFSFNGGLEDRQFLDSAAPDVLNPIFGLSMIYQLFEMTTLSVNANRAVSASYFRNQITESTALTVGVRQRLLGKLTLDVNGGYGTTSYRASATGLTISREDEHSSINVRLTCPFLKRGTASVFYSWSENSSNETDFKYSSSQVGLEIGFRY